VRLYELVGYLLDFEGDPDALREGTEGVAVEDQVGGVGVAEDGLGSEAGGRGLARLGRVYGGSGGSGGRGGLWCGGGGWDGFVGCLSRRDC
jgi:hypothetical protein